jgi:hypothetical protein
MPIGVRLRLWTVTKNGSIYRPRRRYTIMENHDEMMMPAGEYSWLVHESSPVILPAVIWYQTGGMRERIRRSPSKIFLFLSRDFYNAVTFFGIGPPALLPNRKTGVLRIFITLKNPFPRSGINPRPLCSVANTLTTTPPRRHGLTAHPVLCVCVWFEGLEGEVLEVTKLMNKCKELRTVASDFQPAEKFSGQRW